MNYKIIKKVRKNGDSLAVNIPQEVVELLGIKEGELLEVIINKLK